MPYTPAFFEVFLALVVVILWARWLQDRPVPRVVVAMLPWVAGAAVVVGQLLALWGLVASSAGDGTMDLPVRWGRWGSAGVVVLCLVTELALTAWSFTRRGSAA